MAGASIALVVLVASAGLVAPASADARRVRAFAVGPKFDLRWVATPDAFADKLGALLDRRRRGAGPRRPRSSPARAGAGRSRACCGLISRSRADRLFVPHGG